MHAMRRWIRLCEAEHDAPSLEQKLAALIQRRDELVHHWNTVIKPTEPQPATASWGGKVHTLDTMQWWNDPERGALWNKQIYPLNQEIEALQAEIKSQRRTAKLKAK